jgi:hypothetical protein
LRTILQKLAGKDRRSIGQSNNVVAEVLAEPALFKEVFSCMVSGDPVISMRAADAMEKITARRPELLVPYKKMLITTAAGVEQKEVRWHIAQMLPRVAWNTAERKKIMDVLHEYLKDNSSIVKTFAMQALADFARQSPELRPSVLRRLRALTSSGTPAMKARGRKLLLELEAPVRHPEGKTANHGASQRMI